MKLISFAVITLLAITVSAQILPSTSATNDAPQCDKDVIKHKILELTAAHKAQQELIKTLEEPGKAEREEQEIKKAQSALVAKNEDLIKVMEQCYDTVIKINILEENLALKAEQDAKSKGRMETSPSSNPHRDILQKQIDEDCPNADSLFAVYDDIDEGASKLDDMIDKAKNPKKQLELIQSRNKVVEASNELAREIEFMRYKCIHAKEMQEEFGWQSLNSLTWGVVQSVWQIFSK
ncbi:hypothetical protein BASA83_012342 [Batrachochytrium salamandrivorans]|nr:hypothetical protein BASA83_012342 [Batrachochytrium salamandrivorans]